MNSKSRFAIRQLLIVLFVICGGLTLFPGRAMAQVDQGDKDCEALKKDILNLQDEVAKTTVALNDLESRLDKQKQLQQKAVDSFKNFQKSSFYNWYTDEYKAELLDKLAKGAQATSRLKNAVEEAKLTIQGLKDTIADLLNKLGDCKKPGEKPEPKPPPATPTPTPQEARTRDKNWDYYYENAWELFGGYQYQRAPDEPAKNLYGLNASLFYNVAPHVSIGGDFSFLFGSTTETVGTTTFDTSLHRQTYLFGPQFNFYPDDKVKIFVHPLFGGVHDSIKTTFGTTTTDFSASAFAMAFGGGMDVRVTPRVSVRVFQADYLPTHFGGEFQNNFRLSTGLVLRMGGK